MSWSYVKAALCVIVFFVFSCKKTEEAYPVSSAPSTEPVIDSATVVTYAGIASPGNYGYHDTIRSLAIFSSPCDIAKDDDGNLYVSDFYNSVIRKISSSGEVTTLAGNHSMAGYQDGSGTSAQFINPAGIDVDQSGNVYVADVYNNCIRKITPDGQVSTIAGSTERGSNDGAALSARFYSPTDVAVDRSTGDIYIADRDNSKIRKLSSDGTVSTLATSPARGSTNNPEFYGPTSLVLDHEGNVYFTAIFSSIVLKLSTSGIVSIVAGNYGFGLANGPAKKAKFSKPNGIEIDAQGNLYVTEYLNHTVRKISTDAIVSTFVGTGHSGNNDGEGLEAQLDYPFGIVIDEEGNFYVADAGNNCIRKIINY